MNVWIVNPFDNLPPEGLRAQRYWLMARAFARAGHEVVYWSADFSHAYKRAREVSALEGRHEGIELRLVHEPPYPKNICLKRLWSHWRFARNWLARAREENSVGRPDVLIVSSPPLALGAAARAFCRQAGAKLVIDIQDAWPETFQRVVPRCLLAPLVRVARRNYRAANAITAVSQRYLDMARAYGASCPMHLCYHGIARSPNATPPKSETSHPHTFYPLSSINYLLSTTHPLYPLSSINYPLSTLQLAYIGNMSLSYDLATVVEAVRETPDVTLDLAGAGPDEAALRTRAADCKRIHFHGYLDEAALRDLLAHADVGVIPMFPASQVGLPGKLADYAAAGLPVISSLPGETAELLARYRAGVAYVAGDKASFKAAMAEARVLEKNDVYALAVEFDAEKLYNSYLNFVLEKI